MFRSTRPTTAPTGPFPWPIARASATSRGSGRTPTASTSARDSYPIQGRSTATVARSGPSVQAGPGWRPPGGGPAPDSGHSFTTAARPSRDSPPTRCSPPRRPKAPPMPPNREYFLSTPDYNGFATTGGAGARPSCSGRSRARPRSSSPTPSVYAHRQTCAERAVRPPVNAAQRPGPRPLGQSVKAPLPPIAVERRPHAAGRVLRRPAVLVAEHRRSGRPTTPSDPAWPGSR